MASAEARADTLDRPPLTSPVRARPDSLPASWLFLRITPGGPGRRPPRSRGAAGATPNRVWTAEASTSLRLIEDEEPALRELLAAAEAVGDETKITKILELLNGSITGRTVLFFTEYKATQSLLMSALRKQFGDLCVAFICRSQPQWFGPARIGRHNA